MQETPRSAVSYDDLRKRARVALGDRTNKLLQLDKMHAEFERDIGLFQNLLTRHRPDPNDNTAKDTKKESSAAAGQGLSKTKKKRNSKPTRKSRKKR